MEVSGVKVGTPRQERQTDTDRWREEREGEGGLKTLCRGGW